MERCVFMWVNRCEQGYEGIHYGMKGCRAIKDFRRLGDGESWKPNGLSWCISRHCRVYLTYPRTKKIDKGSSNTIWATIHASILRSSGPEGLWVLGLRGLAFPRLRVVSNSNFPREDFRDQRLVKNISIQTSSRNSYFSAPADQRPVLRIP